MCAVLVIGGVSFYTVINLKENWAPWFCPRKDEQIMGYELLAILTGIVTFLPLLKGRTLRIWTDNEGGAFSVIRGGSAQQDHNCLVHRFWCLCYEHAIHPWIARVPSEDNISDGPTRGDLAVVTIIGAKPIKAQVPTL